MFRPPDPVRDVTAARGEQHSAQIEKLRSSINLQSQLVCAFQPQHREVRGRVEKRVRQLLVILFKKQTGKASWMAVERKEHGLRGGQQQAQARGVDVCEVRGRK
jgi:hypothetical protein